MVQWNFISKNLELADPPIFPGCAYGKAHTNNGAPRVSVTQSSLGKPLHMARSSVLTKWSVLHYALYQSIAFPNKQKKV